MEDDGNIHENGFISEPFAATQAAHGFLLQTETTSTGGVGRHRGGEPIGVGYTIEKSGSKSECFRVVNKKGFYLIAANSEVIEVWLISGIG